MEMIHLQHIMVDMDESLFKVGKVFISYRARQTLHRLDLKPVTFLARHCLGDWVISMRRHLMKIASH